MKDYQEKLDRVRSLLKEDKAQEAFRALLPVFRYPGMMQRPEEFAAVLAVFAEISAKIAGDEFTSIVRHTLDHIDDPGALYSLGYELIDQGLPAIAATVLAEAHRLAPNNVEILTELCAALERSTLYADACRYLKAAPEVLQHSFLCSYLLAFNSLMSGDLKTTRRLLPDLQRLQEQDEHFAALSARIIRMLRRADALSGHAPLDTRDLRGWHMVITSGLLLHVSPHGFDEGMNGRYAFVQDTLELCLEGIERVKAVLAALEITPPRIFALPERGSSILAQATARILDCPLENWPDGGSEEPGLIVAYDLALLDEDLLPTLLQHHPGQILWNHASCWTEDQPISGDLTTFLYQVNYEPWGERIRVDQEQQQAITEPPDERDEAIIAAEIVSATLEPGTLDDLPALIELARAAAATTGEAAPGLLCSGGRRKKQWSGSPVPSSRFT
ncbi:hypothetical protein KSF_079300 [Reticulibacter mediterranei]|uniref:Uncharacterized protein n=1 Tax=Reticulibacter mediterranei TaxID=2778369 RepID=A0A8J3N467_9CHLR|nr:hypothetical protein [Reticulibacter mediterranei]GHO97882.1 hypothetical protein KSF_079300 [Reticulibacter mediterranei]